METNSTNKKIVKVEAEVDVDGHYLTAQWQPVLEYPVSSGSSGNALDQDSARTFSVSVRTNKSKREHNDTIVNSAKNGTLVLGELVMATTAVNLTSSSDVLENKNTTDPDLKLKMSLMGEFVRKSEKNNDPPYEFVKPDSLDDGVAVNPSTKAEIKEPILPATTPRQHRASKQGKWHPEAELNPPSVADTESWHNWEPPSSNRRVKNTDLEKNSNSTLSALTIQFLPQRLISFLEQAEKYARIALSPFLSSDSETKGQRRLRFLPSFWWGKNEERTEKKLLDVDVKDKDSKNETLKPIVAIPYVNKKTDAKLKYIPLTSSAETNTKMLQAEPDFNRPAMIKAHMEEPIIEDSKEEEKKES